MPPNNKHDKKKKGEQREEGGAKAALLCCVPEGEHVTRVQSTEHGNAMWSSDRTTGMQSTEYRAHD